MYARMMVVAWDVLRTTCMCYVMAFLFVRFGHDFFCHKICHLIHALMNNVLGNVAWWFIYRNNHACSFSWLWLNCLCFDMLKVLSFNLIKVYFVWRVCKCCKCLVVENDVGMKLWIINSCDELWYYVYMMMVILIYDI